MNRRVNMNPNGIDRAGVRTSESGIVLVVALLLLFVVTVLGLTAMSGTTTQSRMAANQYDRQLAFQAASSALQVAADQVITSPGVVARNCQTGGVQCGVNPFRDGLSDTVIQSVSSAQYNPSAGLIGTPQYIVENMGIWQNPISNTGFNQSANSAQYGAQGKSTAATYYRITVRSADPSAVSDRAIVTVQATYMR